MMTQANETLVTECLWGNEIETILDEQSDGATAFEARIRSGKLETRRGNACAWLEHGEVWSDEQAAAVVSDYLADCETALRE